MLTFALDFDDTFTADAKLWWKWWQDAREHGHRVLIVTARMETEENVEIIQEHLETWGMGDVPVFLTSMGSKLEYMEAMGIKVDIWMDDDPHSLVHGH